MVADQSVATTGSLTVSAWLRPDTLSFPKTEGSGYVHWLGKGAGNQEEWTFRMYSQPNQENRANRISFYVFNLRSPQPPNLGIGSYFQDLITPGQWIHVVGVADGHQTRIYANGVQRTVQPRRRARRPGQLQRRRYVRQPHWRLDHWQSRRKPR